MRRTLARRDSADVLDRLTVSLDRNVPPVLTAAQAEAGRLLRWHVSQADAGVAARPPVDDRIDNGGGGMGWPPDYSGGRKASKDWLTRMCKTMRKADVEIVMAVAVFRRDPVELARPLLRMGMERLHAEMAASVRRAFEALRVFSGKG